MFQALALCQSKGLTLATSASTESLYSSQFTLSFTLSDVSCVNPLLPQTANARNISFQISLQWPIHIITPVDKTKINYLVIIPSTHHHHFFRNVPPRYNVAPPFLLDMVANHSTGFGSCCLLMELDIKNKRGSLRKWHEIVKKSQGM